MYSTECIVQVFQESYASVSNILGVVGAVWVSYTAVKLLLSLWTNIRTFILARFGCGFGVKLTSLGSWAVVTGATDGIGKAYAQQIAEKGLNVVLISRSIDKLNKVAREIEAESGVETKCIAIDFTGGPEIYEKIAEELKNVKDIGLLVNNVGIATKWPDYFLNDSDQSVRDVINVNCNAVTFMTKMVLPGMIDRRKGAIVNIGSLVGTVTTPTFAIYAATKAFIDSFSRSIAVEYKPKGIIIQSVMPGLLSTPMSKTRPLPFVPEAPEWVRSTLATLGVQNRTAGFFSHNISWCWFAMPKPAFIHNLFMFQFMSFLRSQLQAAERQHLNNSKLRSE